MRLTALLLALAALPAAAEILSPSLRVERSGDVLLLRLEGTADVKREVADWGPLVEVEYSFVPLLVERTPTRVLGVFQWSATSVREGTEVSLGRGRARVLRDAVEDNPPYLEARPFAVAGLFPGVYRARLVLEPSRQSARLRAKGVPSAAALAQAPWGDPSEFPRRARETRLRIEEDAATLLRLSRDLEGLWERWRSASRAGEEWTAELAEWRERIEMISQRNERVPANAILGSVPAAKSAIAEACAAMESLAGTCEEAMRHPPEARRDSAAVQAAAGRTHRALLGLDRAATRRDPEPDPAPARRALAVLRGAPADLREWTEAWAAGRPGHAAADWPDARARFEDSFTEALFTAGRAAPPSSYADLAAVARLLLEDLPGGAGRNPSLLAACASRILRQSGGRPDEDWQRSCAAEYDVRLGRLEKALESK